MTVLEFDDDSLLTCKIELSAVAADWREDLSIGFREYLDVS